jgi:hypothetical protein
MSTGQPVLYVLEKVCRREWEASRTHSEATLLVAERDDLWRKEMWLTIAGWTGENQLSGVSDRAKESG